MNKNCYEIYFDQYDKLTYRNVGVAMLPMLEPRKDLFTVQKKKKERCKKYDVILCRREGDRYVLQRVIKVREGDYVILGDNCESKEASITDEDILGVLISFKHKGKEYKVNDWRYQFYSHVWLYLYPVRKICFWLKHFSSKYTDPNIRMSL